MSLPSPTLPDNAARIYGLLAEFASGEDLTKAAQVVHDSGYTRIDAYSPFPIEGLAEALGFKQTRLPLIALAVGIVGGLTGYLLQWWTMVRSYPINVGGRPLHSWPAFIPVTFELTILGASLAAVLGMLALNKLPQPYHPLFNIPEFSLATQNRFFLSIEAADRLFDLNRCREMLVSIGALKVSTVEY